MKKQQGFTVMELVTVVAILSILMAVALPKFVSLQGDARLAKMNGALAAVKATATLAHAQLLARGLSAVYTGTPGSDGTKQIVAEGGIIVSYRNGYPEARVMSELSGLAATDYVIEVSGNALVVTSDLNHPNCSFRYTEPELGTAVQTANGVQTTTSDPTAGSLPEYTFGAGGSDRILIEDCT